MRSVLNLSFKAGRGRLGDIGAGWVGIDSKWMNGWINGGVSGVDWDIADFEREMTSKPEGPLPTTGETICRKCPI